MAEIAIPAIALGAMYILSTQKEKELTRENFDNVSGPAQGILKPGSIETGKPRVPRTNFPIQTYEKLTDNPKFYPAPNAATDRYYRQDVYEKQVEEGGNPSNGMLFKSLTGDMVQKKDIKFNNMVPFFGAKVTQRTTGYNGNEALLDQSTGYGSQQIRKKEQAPLFAPQDNMSFPNGMPSHTDFIQSRMNPSRNVSNTKPWQEIHVGPGLNKGYTNKGSDGFNAGMEARNSWLPKTVDQLRVVTNPKVTFGLANHEGPANSTIKKRGFEGRVEKNRPDTFYFNDPSRWFTTTGQEKAQRARSQEPLQPVSRPYTTRQRFGPGNANQGGASTGGVVEPKHTDPKRPQLPPYNKYLGAAHNLNYATGWTNLKQDYGKAGFFARANARTTTRQPTEMGIVGGWFRAMVAPVMDVLRPSRKENVVGNLRPTGNAGGAYGVEQAAVWNPADRPKTTIREQTEDNQYPSQPFYPHGGGYATEKYQPIENQRETTNCSYIGNAAAAPWASNGPVYNAAYNAHLNPNKEQISRARTNHGCESLFSGSQNIKSSKIGSVRSAQGPVNMPKESANLSTVGELGSRNVRESSIGCRRSDPALLNAFRSNPYTQSLKSVA